jgi:hypothetical protein
MFSTLWVSPFRRWQTFEWANDIGRCELGDAAHLSSGRMRVSNAGIDSVV